MDLLLYWLPIVGGTLLGGLAFAAWYGGNKVLSVWSGFASVVCFLLLAALQAPEAIVRDERQSLPVIDSRNLQGPVVSLYRFVFNSVAGTEGNPGTLEFQPIIKNSGRTPALNMKANFVLAGRSSMIPEDFDYADIDSGQTANISILAAGQELESGIFKVSTAYADRVRSGDGYLFLYGWIEYDDNFEVRPR